MTQRKVVAIHQPNFFPWLGYFDKIIRSDVFIFMDNVQFSKTGGTWSNRVKLIVGGKASWVTMPIIRSYHGLRRIDEMQINETTFWRAKLFRTIEMNYSHAPFFQEVSPLIKNLTDQQTNCLSNYNISAISALASSLGVDSTKLVLGSTLKVEGQSTDLLINMVKSVSGTAYLCGGGAGGYQEDSKFSEAGLELIYQDFHSPTYPQVHSREFVSGLSIIDALMNCGFEHTKELLVGQRK